MSTNPASQRVAAEAGGPRSDGASAQTGGRVSPGFRLPGDPEDDELEALLWLVDLSYGKPNVPSSRYADGRDDSEQDGGWTVSQESNVRQASVGKVVEGIVDRFFGESGRTISESGYTKTGYEVIRPFPVWNYNLYGDKDKDVQDLKPAKIKAGKLILSVDHYHVPKGYVLLYTTADHSPSGLLAKLDDFEKNTEEIEWDLDDDGEPYIAEEGGLREAQDSRAGAVQVANKDYGLSWKEADVIAVPDPKVRNVWLLIHKGQKMALAVNTKDEEVVDEYDFNEAMRKYGSRLKESRSPSIESLKSLEESVLNYG